MRNVTGHGQLVRRWREELGKREGKRYSQAEFAETLQAIVGQHGKVNRDMVSGWELGTVRLDYSWFFMLYTIAYADGWAVEFAQDVLHALKPDLWDAPAQASVPVPSKRVVVVLAHSHSPNEGS